MQVQLESTPPGADARTSLGPGCKTPCSVTVAAPETGFSVTYTLNRFQPATIPVQVIHVPGDFDAGLHHDRSQSRGSATSAGWPAAESAARKKVHAPKKPKPPKTAAAPPPPTGSPFPDPGRGSAHPRRRRRPPADYLHCTISAQPGADCTPIASCLDYGSEAALALPICPAQKGSLNERIVLPAAAVPSDDRPVWPGHQLSARFGHRSLRPALLLLHVGRHDIPAQGRLADARGTRPSLFGVHRQGRAQVAADRRRTAGPAQRDVAGAFAVAPSRYRRAA